MKRTLIAAALLLPPLFLMSACNYYADDADISKINLKNDLGKPAEIALCKGDPHCEAIEEIWPQKMIGLGATKTITVSKGVKMIFHVSTEIEGKSKVSCLRVPVVRPIPAIREVLLSSATEC